MALIIQSSTKQKLLIAGTSIDIKSIYCRAEFNFIHDGKRTTACLYVYENKDAFKKAASTLKIDNFQVSGYLFELKEQTTENAHEELKKILAKKGYKVTVEL